jgi:hypothetical protein
MIARKSHHLNKTSLHGLLKNSPQKPQRSRSYFICLTRGYTDGAMDRHAEKATGMQQKKMTVYCYQEYQNHFQCKGSLFRAYIHT